MKSKNLIGHLFCNLKRLEIMSLSGIIPAMNASKQNPVEALRG